jgi:hypothetical protein
MIVYDGTTRHHGKRSTTKRLTESYLDKTALNTNIKFLMSLISEKDASDSVLQKALIFAGVEYFANIKEEVEK